MELYGIYKKTIFRDEYNSYTCFVLDFYHPVNDYENITSIVCKGKIPCTHICRPVLLTGEISKDSEGNYLFEFEKAELYVNEKAVAADILLNSGDFRGMTEETAKTFLSVSGNDIFGFAGKTDAEELLEKEGIPSKKAHNWMLNLIRIKRLQDLIDYFSEYNISYAKTEKIYRKYGAKVIEKIKANPYRVGLFGGLKFSVCDRIGKDNGYKYNDVERIKYLVYCTMEKLLSNGDMYVELSDLLDGIKVNLKYTSFPTDVFSITELVCVIDRLDFVRIDYDGDKVLCYFKSDYEDEIAIAENINRLNRFPEKYELKITEKIEEIEQETGIKYSAKQKECFYLINSSGAKVITGGPGTGKSTVIDGIIRLYNKVFPDKTIVMMAPTGRAAKRITEITKRPAGTIHRMLNIKPFSGVYESEYFMNYPGDLIIVDEASMIDSFLMAVLLKAVKSNSTVIFVGDTDQLPSVGAGNVLFQFIKNEHIKNIRLDVNHRQGEESSIVHNAIKIRNGKSDIISDKPDFKVIECDDGKEVHEAAVRCFKEFYDKANPDKCQLLTPIKKSPIGTVEMNKELQQWVDAGEKIVFGYSTEFRKGDKVMTVVNNYDAEYFNGDVGVVSGVCADGIKVKVDDKEITVNRKDLADLTLAYATTVHKSQGSEYDTAIIVLPEEPSIILRRNIFYTAVTRAKKKVIVITKKGCVEKAVNNRYDRVRNSCLSNKINEFFKKAG